MRRLAAVTFALLVLSLPVSPGCDGRRRARGANVVLISIDTLRADHLSHYGYPRRTSPTLDRLGREGTVFTRAYSATSWTVPSHMTMLTSLPDLIHEVDDVGKSLDSARVTMAERFKAAGYHAAAFVSGPTLHPAFGFGQGFDLYENLSGIAERDYMGDPLRFTRAWRRAHGTVTGPRVRAAVERWLASKARTPFFLFVHLWDPHYDYMPPPPYDAMFGPDYRGSFDFSNVETNAAINARMPEADRKHLVALYDGEIAFTDATVKGIVEALRRRGVLEDTLIVLTSDHGEEFFEHGGKGHFKTLHEEVLHVPLIFRFPGVVDAGRRVDSIFDPVDLMPTILGLVGIEAGIEARGTDRSATLLGGAPFASGEAFARLVFLAQLPLYSLRTSDRRYLFTPAGHDSFDLRTVYYDLARDPRTQHPIERLDDPARRRVEETLQRIQRDRAVAAALPREGSKAPPMDARTREQLKALGYLQ